MDIKHKLFLCDFKNVLYSSYKFLVISKRIFNCELYQLVQQIHTKDLHVRGTSQTVQEPAIVNIGLTVNKKNVAKAELPF